MEINLDYRKETVASFFEHVKSGNSFYMLGAPSVGKTRFIDFVMGDDFDALREGGEPDHSLVKNRYLGSELAARTWLIRVDMNLFWTENGWGYGFFELLLNRLLRITYVEQREDIEEIRDQIAPLASEVIESKDTLKAFRFFEMAVTRLCHEYKINLVFFFDEFDEIYKTLPKDVFAYLRAVRDANKYSVSYVLFLRNLPEKLRTPDDNESFYELLSRRRLGLGPFSSEDAFWIMEKQLEKRYEITLESKQREVIYRLSGGHPGLIKALLTLYQEKPDEFMQARDLGWFANGDSVQEECRKIWAGLLEKEKKGLSVIVQNSQTAIDPEAEKLLMTKGIIDASSGGEKGFFSPLFKQWVLGRE